jgi:hypothetical protein
MTTKPTDKETLKSILSPDPETVKSYGIWIEVDSSIPRAEARDHAQVYADACNIPIMLVQSGHLVRPDPVMVRELDGPKGPNDGRG